MRRDQWNFVFLACAMCVAAFSVFVAFRMTGRVGFSSASVLTGNAYSASTSTSRVSMQGLAAARRALEEQLQGDPRKANRRVVLMAASGIAAHGDDLALNQPETISKSMSVHWDSYLEQMRLQANTIADVAASPDSDMGQARRPYAILKKTCVDCHAKFSISLPETP
jgi:hypothetical protein